MDSRTRGFRAGHTGLRRFRAALSVGIFWGLAWLPIGAALAFYASLSPPRPSDLLYRPVDFRVFLTAWTIWGGLSGLVFALILGAAERRHTLAELSVARTAGWGALGSASVPGLLAGFDVLRGATAGALYDWSPAVVSLIVSAGLGAACAAGTLAVARRPTGNPTPPLARP